MELSVGQIKSLKARIVALVNDEIDLYVATGSLDVLLEKYGIPLVEDEDVVPQTINRRMVILVVGDLRGKQENFVKAAKELGISRDNLEFVDFNQIKTFDKSQLHYSHRYSDIICGPIPHKTRGIRKSTSLISQLENAPDKEEYPKVIRATSEQKDAGLKLTISSFKRALLQTKLIKEL